MRIRARTILYGVLGATVAMGVSWAAPPSADEGSVSLSVLHRLEPQSVPSSDVAAKPNRPTIAAPARLPESTEALPPTESAHIRLTVVGDETALPQRFRVEEPATPAVSVGERLRQAFELSQAAKSEVHYTTIIGWCRQVLDTATRDETKQYAHRLMSWSYNRRGEHLASIEHLREAFADFNAAIRHDKTRWRAFHNRGMIHGLEGRHKEARGDFTRAVELNPVHAEGYFKRGEVNFMSGDYDNAIRDFTYAIRVSPNHTAARNGRGYIYHRMGKYRRAVHDFTEAIRLDSNDAAAYANRGDLFSNLGYYAEAARDYQSAINADAELGRAYQSFAWLLATCPDTNFRDAAKAVQAANLAIELDGNSDHRYLDTLAAAYASAGDFQQAQQTIHLAVQKAPRELADMYQGRIRRYQQERPLLSQPRPLAKQAQNVARRKPRAR